VVEGRGIHMEPQVESGSSIVRPMFKKSRRKWLYAGAAVVIVLGVGIPVTIHAMKGGSTISGPMIYTVGYGNIVQSVSASGTIQPAATADLNFADSTSTVTQINVKIGQTVKKGQVLAVEDDSSAKAALLAAQAGVAQAQAGVASAQANLTKTMQGATSSQILADKQAIQKAELSLQSAQQSYQSQLTSSKDTSSQQQKILSAQTQLQNDQLAASDTSGVTSAQLQLSSDGQSLATDQQTLKNLQAQYGTVTEAQVQQAWQQYQYEDGLSQKWLQGQQVGQNPYASADAQDKATYDNLNTEYSSLQTAQQTVTRDQQAIQKDQQSLTTAQNALAKAKQQVVVDQQNLQLVEQQVNDTSATQQALDSAKNQIQQDQLAVQSAQNQLTTDEQPPDVATVSSAQASVASAEANLQSAQDKLVTAQLAESQTKLIAPINGVVSQVNGQVGQTPSSGSKSGTSTSPFLEIVDTNPNDLQVQVQISESQIGQVQTGDAVAMTVAALPGKNYSGTITQIYPTPTTTSNVTQYTAVATVQDTSGQLKDGMTASVTIQTATANHVVTVPAIALQQEGSIEGVYVLDASSGASGGTGSQGSGQSGQGTGSTSGGRSGQGASGQGSGSGGNFAGRGSSTGGGNGGFRGGQTGGFSGQFTGGSLNSPAGLPKNVHFVPVKVGLFGTAEVQITSGLNAGQKILVQLPAAAAASAAKSSALQFGGPGAGAARRVTGGGGRG
jgi:HlyD family secretion protein